LILIRENGRFRAVLGWETVDFPEELGSFAPEIPPALATTIGANRQNGDRKRYQDVGFRQRLATEKEIIALLLATPATSPKV
jgi:hypothetical protein